MNTPQDYLNTLEGFPENQSLLDKENLCKLLEGYWEWRESKEWTKVKDGLPRESGTVLVATDWDGVGDMFYSEQYGWHVLKNNAKVIAWRKLPTLPK